MGACPRDPQTAINSKRPPPAAMDQRQPQVTPQDAYASDEDRSGALVTAANTTAKPLDNPCPVQTTLECRPSTRTTTDGPGRCAYSYGSEGSRMATEEPAALRCPHCPRREVSGMAGPGDEMAATARRAASQAAKVEVLPGSA
jgi:hypothetical protein